MWQEKAQKFHKELEEGKADVMERKGAKKHTPGLTLRLACNVFFFFHGIRFFATSYMLQAMYALKFLEPQWLQKNSLADKL